MNMRMCLQPRMMAAFGQLLKAHRYARDVNSDVWDFAVEIDEFQKIGLNTTDLRWLTSQGLVAHAHETSVYGDDRRSFDHERGAVFSKRSCFVLTPDGVRRVRRIRRHADRRDDARGPQPQNGHPVWDEQRHELRLGGVLIKRYKLRSPNQEAVLSKFEQQGWPSRICDPLDGCHTHDGLRRRLQNTITSLNRNQKCRLIVFKGDGTGHGIVWEALAHRPSFRVG
jgi:hypothetical protein